MAAAFAPTMLRLFKEALNKSPHPSWRQIFRPASLKILKYTKYSCIFAPCSGAKMPAQSALAELCGAALSSAGADIGSVLHSLPATLSTACPAFVLFCQSIVLPMGIILSSCHKVRLVRVAGIRRWEKKLPFDCGFFAEITLQMQAMCSIIDHGRGTVTGCFLPVAGA